MRTTVKIGRMRHLVTIQQQQGTTQSVTGRTVPNWITVGTRYATLDDLSGQEVWFARQVTAKSTHSVEMYYFSGFTARHRLLFRGRYFYPSEPPRNEDELNWVLRFMVEEKTQ